ncbi:MAG: ribosome small subunit-dependent GTPase A [Oscillospiraceae bacterium]|nr:ribosome small subunit-dependent GTPase A [Oscillospiraceae bacterium]
MTFEGVIISSFGTGYKVASLDGEIYTCKAKGIFRQRNISPCCGDRVTVETAEGVEPLITEVHPRKNEIIRPPLANLDQMVFIMSTCEPPPNLLMLDKFSAVAQYKGIESVIVFTKTDKQPADDYVKIYRGVYPVFEVNNETGEGCDEVKKALQGKFSAFCGNSGSGKSSTINNICPELGLATAEISKSLGRGKHTTRRVDIFELDCGGYIADTPGFSTFETGKYDTIFKDELADCFPEFRDYLGGQCRFQDCSHTKETGCAILEAVRDGKISESRHRSYCEMYREASLIKPWELKDRQKR